MGTHVAVDPVSVAPDGAPISEIFIQTNNYWPIRSCEL